MARFEPSAKGSNVTATAPFQEAISYRLDVLSDDSRLADNGTVVPHYDRERGPPSPELEAAWDELLQCACAVLPLRESKG